MLQPECVSNVLVVVCTSFLLVRIQGLTLDYPSTHPFSAFVGPHTSAAFLDFVLWFCMHSYNVSTTGHSSGSLPFGSGRPGTWCCVVHRSIGIRFAGCASTSYITWNETRYMRKHFKVLLPDETLLAVRLIGMYGLTSLKARSIIALCGWIDK
jgi:hypothetical protein